MANLSADIRAELGLICKCCGGDKTGKAPVSTTPIPHNTRAARSISVNSLMGSLKRSDTHILHLAAESECFF